MKKLALNIAIIVAVCVIVLVVHWPALSAKAVSFDDDTYVTNNLLVQNPGWASANRFLTEVFSPSTVGGYYQPLAMISLMFDDAVGGRTDNLMPFHRTSIALHVANTVLIIVLLYLLFGNIWLAAAAGLLFGVHPMTVESIAWVTERKTLLAAFFSFWSLLFYILFTRTAAKKYYAVCLLAYLMALMSKPTSMFLPFVMILMDYWPLNRFSRNSLSEKSPFYILLVVFAVITFISQSATLGCLLPGQGGHSLLNPPLIICHNIIFYPCKMLWPVDLTSFYAYPKPFMILNPRILGDVIATLFLIVLLVVSLRWTRAALTGWLIFFVAILPTMQILKFSFVIASDKFAYLPSFGLLMMLTSFLLWFCSNKPRRAMIVLIVVLSLTVTEGIATRKYLACWKDTFGLYNHMLALAPDSVPVYCQFAIAYGQIGQNEKAMELLEKAVTIDPSENQAWFNLGVAYFQLGRYQEAIDAFRKTIDLVPDSINAYIALGSIYDGMGRFTEGLELYKQAEKFAPQNPQVLYGLGRFYLKTGDPNAALRQYEILKQLDAAQADALRSLIQN